MISNLGLVSGRNVALLRFTLMRSYDKQGNLIVNSLSSKSTPRKNVATKTQLQSIAGNAGTLLLVNAFHSTCPRGAQGLLGLFSWRTADSYRNQQMVFHVEKLENLF